MIKKAMFMEGHAPKGGTCLSSFLILKGSGGILAGKMVRPEIWVERFFVGEQFAPKYAESNKWLLPACHLKYGEKPEDAARRVLTEQAGLKNVKLALREVQSHLAEDPNDSEAAHWDICFVYEGNVKGKVERPEWFSELKFVKPKDVTSDDFTRGHGDVLREAKIIRK
jgi:ADP-ribose pyrophosphatase YjhB (NUDIX family)